MEIRKEEGGVEGDRGACDNAIEPRKQEDCIVYTPLITAVATSLAVRAFRIAGGWGSRTKPEIKEKKILYGLTLWKAVEAETLNGRGGDLVDETRKSP